MKLTTALPTSSAKVIALAMGLVSSAAAQVTIGTGYTSGNPASVSIDPSDYAVDVFTVPATDSELTSISAWYQYGPDSGPDYVTASVYAWNGTATTGAALASATGNFPENDNLAEVTFADLGVDLTPGAAYAIVLGTYNQSYPNVYTSTTDAAFTGYYDANGSFSANTGGKTADVTATFVSPGGSGGASPVPEYSWMIWAGLGMVGGIAVLRFRPKALGAATRTGLRPA